MMHRIFIIFICTAFLMGCGGQSTSEISNEEDDSLEQNNELEDNTMTTDLDSEEIDHEEVTTDPETDWDAALDEYEAFVDEYIELLEKANEGDASALVEYPSVLGKAQSTSQKLEKAQGDLSPEQTQRLLSIQQKLASAATQLK